MGLRIWAVELHLLLARGMTASLCLRHLHHQRLHRLQGRGEAPRDEVLAHLLSRPTTATYPLRLQLLPNGKAPRVPWASILVPRIQKLARTQSLLLSLLLVLLLANLQPESYAAVRSCPLLRLRNSHRLSRRSPGMTMFSRTKTPSRVEVLPSTWVAGGRVRAASGGVVEDRPLRARR